MANHGLIVAGDDPSAIRANTDEILRKIAERLGEDWRTNALGAVRRVVDVNRIVRGIGPALRGLLAEDPAGPLKVVVFDDSDTTLGLIGTQAGRTTASPDR